MSLIECCPDIWELSLPVDARDVPVDTPEDIKCHPALKLIYFPESPIGDAQAVQAFLARHFPFVIHVLPSFITLESVDDIDEDEGDGGEREVGLYVDLWHVVNVHLDDLHFPSLNSAS